MYALVLCGGRGERLQPLTDTIPKPMVLLGDKPILWHQVQWLKAGGITDVVFLAGYRWEAIKEFFGDGSPYGFRAHYSVEETPLGRGGAIRQALSLVPATDEVVVVTNGDVVTTQGLAELLRLYEQSRRQNPRHMVTIMVVPFVSPFGMVEVDDRGAVTGFSEKSELPHWINGGVYVLNRKIEAELPTEGDHETETFPELAARGRITALRSRAFWRSIDSFKDLREAREQLQMLPGPAAGREKRGGEDG